MWLLPRLRLEFARRPWLYWMVVAVCALMVWARLAAVEADAEHARTAWGTPRTVVVATAEAAPGEAVAVEARRYPAAMVPAAALTQVPHDLVAARHLVAGAILVTDDLVGPSVVPPGWVVLAVPANDAPAFAPGQGAAVFAGGQRACDGVVATSTDDHVELAVPPECALPLSIQLQEGGVVLARVQ